MDFDRSEVDIMSCFRKVVGLGRNNGSLSINIAKLFKTQNISVYFVLSNSFYTRTRKVDLRLRVFLFFNSELGLKYLILFEICIISFAHRVYST